MSTTLVVEKKYYCRKCKKWKRKQAFSVDNTGYLSTDGVKSKCKVCQNKYFKKWYEKRGAEMKHKRVAKSVKTEQEAYERFMSAQAMRIDFGLPPRLQAPGVSGIKIAGSIDEAIKVVKAWKAAKDRAASPLGELDRQIAELRRKMGNTLHLERLQQTYQQELDQLLAKLNEMETSNVSQLSDNGRAMGVVREGSTGGVSGTEE